MLYRRHGRNYTKFSPAVVRIASKFKHNPPTALGVIVGKSGLAYRRQEDGVYVLPLAALKP